MREKSTYRPRGHSHRPIGCGCGKPRTRVSVRCPVCRAMFEAKPSELRRGKQWCKWACYLAGKARNDLEAAQHAWRRVDRSGFHWPFTGALNSAGYGNVKMNGRWKLMSHVAWFLATGAWPAKGETICHTLDCGSSACCRNDDVGTYEVDGIVYPRRGHLFLATQPTNTRDAAIKGRMMRGERHGWAVLTEDQVREIRRRYAAGDVSFAQLGREYGVTRHNIRAIVTRTSWKHVL